MRKQLPLNQEQLENFILHHVHLWAREEYEENDKGIEFTEEMDAQLKSFVTDLLDKFEEVLPRFEEVA